MPMGRVKRETGILVPEDEADDEGSLSGLTNFQLVVYNPEELQETDGTLETGKVEKLKNDRWSIFRVNRFFCNVVIYYPQGPKET